jgi:hypothetical protein
MFDRSTDIPTRPSRSLPIRAMASRAQRYRAAELAYAPDNDAPAVVAARIMDAMAGA